MSEPNYRRTVVLLELSIQLLTHTAMDVFHYVGFSLYVPLDEHLS